MRLKLRKWFDNSNASMFIKVSGFYYLLEVEVSLNLRYMDTIYLYLVTS